MRHFPVQDVRNLHHRLYLRLDYSHLATLPDPLHVCQKCADLHHSVPVCEPFHRTSLHLRDACTDRLWTSPGPTPAKRRVDLVRGLRQEQQALVYFQNW